MPVTCICCNVCIFCARGRYTGVTAASTPADLLSRSEYEMTNLHLKLKTQVQTEQVVIFGETKARICGEFGDTYELVRTMWWLYPIQNILPTPIQNEGFIVSQDNGKVKK